MHKIVFIFVVLFSNQLFADIRATSIPQVSSFITTMVNKHGFNKKELEFLFDNIILTIKKPVKKTNQNKKPHHRITWDKFRKIFLTKSRIENGAKFLKKHYKTLEKAEKKYGIPKAIIVAILGIETNYGKDSGKYSTMKTLTALAFGKNPRQKFYKKELEEFLLMARKNEVAPLSVSGSHAGAFGYAQFISSSFNHYAVDFNGDGVISLFNFEDAIGSIANYFAKHYWQKGGAFAKKVDKNYEKLATFATNKPRINTKIKLSGIANNKKIAFIKLKNKHKIETWATFWNFYVITRYNHDNKYAMATIELARAIINRLQKQ